MNPPRHPQIVFKIEDIYQTTDYAVLVKFSTGCVKWLPKTETEFTPGHVWVTPWLAQKIRKECNK